MNDVSEIDFDAYYKVDGWGGIAFYLTGWAKDEVETEHVAYVYDDTPYFEYSTEIVESDTQVIAIMVGDDTEHIVDVDSLTKIDADDFCGGCGQIGCSW